MWTYFPFLPIFEHETMNQYWKSLLESIKKNFTQIVKHRFMQENPLPPSRRSSPPTNTLLAFPPILKYFQHTWQEFPFSYIILFTNGKWQFLPLFIQNSCFYETHPNLFANYTLIPPRPTHAEFLQAPLPWEVIFIRPIFVPMSQQMYKQAQSWSSVLQSSAELIFVLLKLAWSILELILK